MDHASHIKTYLYQKVKRVLKIPYQRLRYPFIDPGEGYEGNLWDWDSYWTAQALLYVLRTNKENAEHELGCDAKTVIEHIQGCVQNFLDVQEPDGYIPIVLTGDGSFTDFFITEHRKGTRLNQIKPFLCQASVNISEYTNDYQWVDVERLITYLEYYEKEQRDENTGLFIWENDIMIGIDNNPTVFFRPLRSSADIYLNSFMYLEYVALAKILTQRNDNRAKLMAEKGEKLKTAINTYMWDKRDGIYYSQDVNFYRTPIAKDGNMFHGNFLPHWKTLPMRIRFWGCFLPLYAGIADDAQVKRLVRHLKNKAVMAKYGVRTLAEDEIMYNLERTSNPSNWLGAIWTIANYCVWKGLCRYKQKKLAQKLRKATIKLIGKNIKEKGDTFESYHPDNGEANLYPGFLSWNLLLMEMIDG